MSALAKACPSGRLSRADLIQKAPYGRSQLVVNGMLFGALKSALVPLAHNLRSALISVIQLEPAFTTGLDRADPSGRLRPMDLIQSVPYGLSQRVTQQMFFGVLKVRFNLGIVVVSPPGSRLIASTAITYFLIDVLTPPIGTILTNPHAEVLLTMSLGITRPRDFMPPSSGGSANVGYAGG